MMTNIIIVKYSHLILMMEMIPTHKNQWKNIQSFNRLSDILRGQLGLHSVVYCVTTTSNAITNETTAAYEEVRNGLQGCGRRRHEIIVS